MNYLDNERRIEDGIVADRYDLLCSLGTELLRKEQDIAANRRMYF